METIIFLEGTKFLQSAGDFKSLSKEYKCLIMDDLYNDPNNLQMVPVINPKYIYLSISSLCEDNVQYLIDVFKKLKYTPAGVLFGDQESCKMFLKKLDLNQWESLRVFVYDCWDNILEEYIID